DDRHRTLSGKALKEPAHRPERFFRYRRPLSKADQLAKALGDQPSVLLLFQYRFELPGCLCRYVILCDARSLLNDFRDRPESDPIPVGKAASAQNRRFVFDCVEEFLQQPGLTDPGRAKHRKEMTGPLPPGAPVGLGRPGALVP